MIKNNSLRISLALISIFTTPLAWSENQPPVAATESYKVICENPADCHPAVAGLLSDNENVCTAVLIKDNLLATNQHCLPKDLRRQGASCKGRIRFTFPGTKTEKEEFAECNTVMFISSALQDTPLTPDYAFLQLQNKVHRKPVKISTQGVANEEVLTIYKIDPHEDIGLLRKVTCKAAQGSMLNPLFLTAQSSVISLVPCDIVSGNSGSPVFSTNNEVKALINSRGVPADFPVNIDRFSVAFASNFSCLNIPELNLHDRHKDCQTSKDRLAIRNASGVLVRKAVQTLMPNFAKNVSEQFKKIHEQTQDLIKWDTDQKDIPYTGDESLAIAKVTFRPRCITASREKLDEVKELLNLNYSEWGVELHLDAAGRPTPQLAAKEIRSTLKISRKDLSKNEVEVQWNQSQFAVPFCSDLAKK